SPASSEEVRLLADAMFDGRIASAQVQRLDELIFSDLGCLQAYLERMTFHAEVLRQAEGRTSGQAAMGVMKEFSTSIRLQRRRDQIRQYWMIGSLVTALLIMVPGMFYLNGAFQPAPLGIVSGLSQDLQITGNRVDLGQVVRIGETFSITHGIVSIQLPHALVDVLGPATVRLEGSEKLSLSTGKLFAKILTQNTRLTVTTPDVEVVDLGTEFLVEHQPETGTVVSVRQGRVRASLLNWQGQPSKVLELTDRRSAQFQGGNRLVKEAEFRSQNFIPIDRSRGGIRSIDGALRMVSEAPADLRAEQVQTPNHMLVIPELQNVVLEQELVANSLEGPVHIPAGTTVSSYLIHYDPPEGVTSAPRGGVKFFDTVTAVIVDSNGLQATDSIFGLNETQFEPAQYRELELDEDQVHISKDRQTVSFYCGVNPGEHLDEARILVIVKQ
ncbi:MAG TPA: FecR domain-containing protein, partial [Planctomicrobium sp.]|nr:FecR domain-containing protein [Planctomicrobium sp.]